GSRLAHGPRQDRGLVVVSAVVAERAAIADEEPEDEQQAADQVEADRDRSLNGGVGQGAEQQREQNRDAADAHEHERAAPTRADEKRYAGVGVCCGTGASRTSSSDIGHFSSGKWQAVRWFTPLPWRRISSGSSTSHVPATKRGQRVWKRQAAGGLI